MKYTRKETERRVARYNAWSTILGVGAFAGAVLTIGFAGGAGWCWQTVVSCIGTVVCAFLSADADASARVCGEIRQVHQVTAND